MALTMPSWFRSAVVLFVNQCEFMRDQSRELTILSLLRSPTRVGGGEEEVTVTVVDCVTEKASTALHVRVYVEVWVGETD